MKGRDLPVAGTPNDWCLMITVTKAAPKPLRDEIAEVWPTLGIAPVRREDLISPNRGWMVWTFWLAHPGATQEGTSTAAHLHYPSKKERPWQHHGKIKKCAVQTLNQDWLTCAAIIGCCTAGAPTSRPGCIPEVPSYLSGLRMEARVWMWLRRKHPKSNWKELRRRCCAGGGVPATTASGCFNPAALRTSTTGYRGTAIQNTVVRPGTP